MSDWDLMMPGMGLTAIGVAGVTISYSGIAHTFIDGMHALTGLTLFIGLIILSAGILNGGISTSNRAKATTLVIMSIVLSFAMYGFTMNSISTLGIFAGVMMIIATPAIVMAYVVMKMPKYAKAVGAIFALAAGTGIIMFVAFGLVGPQPYLLPVEVPEETVEEPEVIPAGTPVFTIKMLEGSSIQGSPDYDPEVANVPQGYVVEWINEDSVAHTATSSIDFGETFDSSLVGPGEKFGLDTTDLTIGEYEYFCIVHPWMVATLIIEEPKEAVTETVLIPEGAGVQQPGQVYYDPDLITVSIGTTVEWVNNDVAIHTSTDKNGGFDSDIIGAGESYSHTFSEDGTFDYFCIVHPWMEGIVIVE